MIEIIGVRFKNAGKVYYFDPNGVTVQKGEYVVVETSRGMECGEVTIENRALEDGDVVKPLKPIVRKATAEDIARQKENAEREHKAMQTCQQKIAAHGLDMKLVDVEFAFDGSKILFYFTADGRVDFRELVKDLAATFHTRIELRQIGVRDEARMLGGLGICGQPFCCAQFLNDFEPVSIKMAKEQGLSLNPTKISGSCGRLMCCLKYEQDVYEEFGKITPKNGALVQTPEGRGTVAETNVLTGVVKVKLEKSPDSPPATFAREDLKVIRDGRRKGGEVEKEEESAKEE